MSLPQCGSVVSTLKRPTADRQKHKTDLLKKPKDWNIRTDGRTDRRNVHILTGTACTSKLLEQLATQNSPEILEGCSCCV
jgi:hypothetical protein